MTHGVFIKLSEIYSFMWQYTNEHSSQQPKSTCKIKSKEAIITEIFSLLHEFVKPDVILKIISHTCKAEKFPNKQ